MAAVRDGRHFLHQARGYSATFFAIFVTELEALWSASCAGLRPNRPGGASRDVLLGGVQAACVAHEGDLTQSAMAESAADSLGDLL